MDDDLAPFKAVYNLFVGYIAAGFSEDQALKLVVYLMMLAGTIPNPFGEANG